MRFTLRTAIVATLLAGAFVGLNVMPRSLDADDEKRSIVRFFFVPEGEYRSIFFSGVGVEWEWRGWPLACVLTTHSRIYWDWPALFVNIVVAGAVTAAALVLVVDRPWRKRTE